MIDEVGERRRFFLGGCTCASRSTALVMRSPAVLAAFLLDDALVLSLLSLCVEISRGPVEIFNSSVRSSLTCCARQLMKSAGLGPTSVRRYGTDITVSGTLFKSRGFFFILILFPETGGADFVDR